MLRELSRVEQRYDAVVAVIRDGLAVSEVAAKLGVSRQSLYRWMARYEAGGIEALAERSHRPKTVPHQMPAVLEARVLELRTAPGSAEAPFCDERMERWHGRGFIQMSSASGQFASCVSGERPEELKKAAYGLSASS